MSDLTDLFHGKINFDQFVAKEWNNLDHLASQAPAELAPLAQAVVSDAKVIVSAAEEWAGTAVSSYVAAHTDGLSSLVVGLLSGVTGGGKLTAATQDAVTGASKLILASIAHEIARFQALNTDATAPAKPTTTT